MKKTTHSPLSPSALFKTDSVIEKDVSLPSTQIDPWFASIFMSRANQIGVRLLHAFKRLVRLPRVWRRRIGQTITAGLLGASLLLAWSPLSGPQAVYAAAGTIDVTRGAAGINNGDGCSLVEAITNANNGAQTHSECDSGAAVNTIYLNGAVYSYTSGYGTDSALPDISGTVTIEAAGARIEKTGPNKLRLLNVTTSGDVTLNDAVITGGYYYGGIKNEGMLTLNRTDVIGNQTDHANGGGILNTANESDAVLVLNDSSLIGNYAYYGSGGGISNESIMTGNAIITMTNTTFGYNSTYEGNGGAINNQAAGAGTARITISQSTIRSNSVDAGGPAYGGGIYNDSGNTEMTISGSLIVGNGGNGVGKQIYDKGGTITADSYNLMGNSGEVDSDAFVGFTPGANDINGTDDGAAHAVNDVVEAALRDRGTLSFALVTGSVAHDQVPMALCNTADQHSRSRSGATCDIGATETGEFSNGNTIMVGITSTAIASGDGCSLAEAIDNVNFDGQYHTDCTAGRGVDTIVLSGNTYVPTPALPQLNSVLVIEGNGATLDNSSGTSARILYAYYLAEAELNELTITGGFTGDSGAGLLSWGAKVTLNNSTVTGNTAGRGGGLALRGDVGELILNHSVVSNNSASNGGGGIHVEHGRLEINQSLIQSNQATASVGAETGGGGVTVSGARFEIKNSTIISNTSGKHGGGVNIRAGEGYLAGSFDHVTITDNEATEEGGGVNHQSGTLTIENSIISGNQGGTGDEFHTDEVSTVTDTVVGHSGLTNAAALSYSFTPAPAFGWTTLTSDGTTPTALTALLDSAAADNGGGTETVALPVGSPAIDFVTGGSCSIDQDQRGAARPQGAGCDLGAFEAGNQFCSLTEDVPLTYKGLSLTVTDAGTNLACVEIERYDVNHPNATTGLQTGSYWAISGLQSDQSTAATIDFTFDIDLPHTVTPHANANVCRYPGGLGGFGWDCGRTSSTDSFVTRTGNTNGFSDWAVGDNVGPTSVTLNEASADAATSSPLASWVMVLFAGLSALSLGAWRGRRAGGAVD